MGREAMDFKLKVFSVVDPLFATYPKVQVVGRLLEHWGYDHTQKIDYLWYGWMSKLLGFIEMVQALDTSYTHVMLIDGSDVVLLAPPELVMERWFTLAHPWVYNAEPNIWSPDSFTPEQYPTKQCKYRYLNAGACIGEREHILKWYSEWTHGFTQTPQHKPRCGDQDWLAERLIRHWPDAIALDHECYLFQAMCASDEHTTVTPGKVYNKLTGSVPVIIHFNGGTDITWEVDPRASGRNRRELWEGLLNESV